MVNIYVYLCVCMYASIQFSLNSSHYEHLYKTNKYIVVVELTIEYKRINKCEK